MVRAKRIKRIRSKRILLLTHEYLPYRGGIATYVDEISRAASSLGHEVTVLAPSYNTDLQHAASSDLRGNRKIMRFGGEVYTAWDLFPMLMRTWRMVMNKKYDLIHVADWPDLLGMAFVNRFLEVPFISTAYGSEIFTLKNSLQTKLLGVGNPFQFASRIHAISRYTRDLLVAEFREIDASKVQVTPLGVSEYWFEPVDDREGIRTSYRVREKEVLLLSVSRIDERKGLHDTLASLEKLPEQLKSRLSYFVVGPSTDAEYLTKLREIALESGVRVEFLGQVERDELKRLYAAADLFCLPGIPHSEKVEGFGLVYLEAAAQELPSLATTSGAVPEVVIHGKTGWLVPPNQPEELANALVRLLDTPELIQQLGREAKERAKDLSWEHCARLTYGEGEVPSQSLLQ